MNLSDDDKKWFEAVIEANLGRLRAASEAYIDARLQEQRVALEAVETRLLTEFPKWASPTELRIQSHAQAIRAIDMELENVKERVSKLEPKQ
jgi:hypothetical protein